MPEDVLDLDEFLDHFESSLDGPDFGDSEYTLILGAGASRSAGIPTAGQLLKVFCKIARYRKRSVENPGDQTNWSFLFGAAFGPDNEFDDDSVPEDSREFITRLVSLASREPNLTNLIAASLASLRVCPLIVTTNYDDLLLAGFWSLPPHIPYSEPHIIYHPSDKYRPVGYYHFTPIVIKAHGHHTEYAVGIVDHQIKELAPCVKKAIKRQNPPRIGYMVVGYSGDWDDGIMQVLRDRSLMAGKELYWFFRGKHPPEGIAAKIWRTAKLHFVRCDDSDFLFLNLWHRASFALANNSLEAGELYCPLPLEDRLRPASSLSSWWEPEQPPKLENIPDPERRKLLHLDDLANKVLPLLEQWDAWEESRVLDRCLPPHIRRGMRRDSGLLDDDPTDYEGPPALPVLRQTIPARVSWGRRDRTLLRLALHPDVDPLIALELLQALAAFR
jgi:hypothetical protein